MQPEEVGFKVVGLTTNVGGGGGAEQRQGTVTGFAPPEKKIFNVAGQIILGTVNDTVAEAPTPLSNPPVRSGKTLLLSLEANQYVAPGDC